MILPEFLKIFIDLFIVLASILGIVVAIHGPNFLALDAFRMRVMALFTTSFASCGIAVVPFILLNIGLDQPTIWRIVSGLAILVCVGIFPIAIKTRRAAKVKKELNTLTIDAGLAALTFFPIWFGINISGQFGPPSATPLGFWLFAAFAISATSFVRIALYQRLEKD